MSKQTNFKFENLQPITYLQKFNQMVEHDIKNPMKTKNNQLKVFALSKFPLPEVYKKMEGIFQAGTKKKDVTNQNIKTKEDAQDQEFFEKHKQFMTKTINKIISDHQHQQKNLQDYKNQYRKKSTGDFVVLKNEFKTKFQKQKNSDMGTEKGKSKSQRNFDSKIMRSEIDSESDPMRLTHMQKLQQERLQSLKNARRQKIRIKENNKIKDFLEERKNFVSERKSRKQGRNEINYNNMEPQDQKKRFIEGTLSLQKDQNKKQHQFGEKIEREIKEFHSEADKNIKRVRSQKFW